MTDDVVVVVVVLVVVKTKTLYKKRNLIEPFRRFINSNTCFDILHLHVFLNSYNELKIEPYLRRFSLNFITTKQLAKSIP